FRKMKQPPATRRPPNKCRVALTITTLTTGATAPKSRRQKPPLCRSWAVCSRSEVHSMSDQEIRAALEQHWAASAAGDQQAEHEIYHENAIVDYPQSHERIRGRQNVQALRSHHPARPSGFMVQRILGTGDLWVTEYVITYDGRPFYTVSIMEFQAG